MRNVCNCTNGDSHVHLLSGAASGPRKGDASPSQSPDQVQPLKVPILPPLHLHSRSFDWRPLLATRAFAVCVCGFHAHAGGVGRPTCVGLPKGKRTRRSKLQKKDSEYLYEFEDTDTEEDQAAQDTSGDGDRNYHANSDSTLLAPCSFPAT